MISILIFLVFSVCDAVHSEVISDCDSTNLLSNDLFILRHHISNLIFSFLREQFLEDCHVNNLSPGLDTLL